MKRWIVLGALVGIGGLSIGVTAGQGPPAGGAAGQRGGRAGGAGGFLTQGPPSVQIQKVRDNVFMLTGGGGNSAVFVRQDDIVLVDTNFPNYGLAILDTIKTVTNKPVTMIINTHNHGDHVGSNDFFGAGIEIVTQENARPLMAKMVEFAGPNAVYLPNKVFNDRMTIGAGKDRIDLYYFGPSHTNNDAWVVFPAAGVLHAGDVFAGRMSPIVDTASGGSSVNFPVVLRRAGELKGIEAVIPGHSPVMTMADLKEYETFTSDFVSFAASQKKAGRTVDEAAAAYKMPANNFANPFFGGVRGWVQTTYNELDAAR